MVKSAEKVNSLFHVLIFEKRAGLDTFVGRIRPAGRTLETPALQYKNLKNQMARSAKHKLQYMYQVL